MSFRRSGARHACNRDLPRQLAHRITTLTLAAAVLCLSIDSGNHGSCAESSGLPNIVLILADDLGFSDIASYGGRDVRTPHLDRLVAAGMKCENFYANSCVCSPTRAALLTGRYPELVGVPVRKRKVYAASQRR